MTRRWSEVLHPRGFHGRFKGKGGSDNKAARQMRTAQKDARKAGQQVADDPAIRKERRKAQRKAGTRAAGGVFKGAVLVGVGLHTKDKKYVAAGVGRIGLAGVEGRHNFKSARDTTSKDFHRMSLAEQTREKGRREVRSANFSLAGGAFDLGATYAARNKINKHLISRLADAKKDRDWRETSEWMTSNHGINHDYNNPHTKYQGPGSHRAKAAGKSRLKGNKGVYNIRSENAGGDYKVGKPASYYFLNRKMGTGKTRAQRAGAKFTSAKNTARARAWKASGGSTAVVIRRNPASGVIVRRQR